MKKLFTLTAIAPLAMLAACADNDAANDADAMDPDATELANTASDDSADKPGPAMRLDDAGDYSGDYEYTGADGKTSSVRLDSNTGTYEFTKANGEVERGEYKINNDGYRFTIDDYNGDIGYFVLSEGRLIRLNSDTEVDGETDVDGERYVRARRGQEDDNAMFSREPEPGSPVAPPVGE